MESLGLILAYLAIGWVLQRTHSLPENSGLVLNQYVIHVAVPAMILLHLPSLEVSAAVLTPIFTPWAMFALAIGLVLLCSRLFKWGRDLTGAMLIVVPLGNTSFLGFPMVETFYGTSALPFAVLYDQAGSFLALALFTSVIAAHYAHAQSGNKPSIKEQAIALLRFPPLIALLVALSVGQTEYPSMLQQLFRSETFYGTSALPFAVLYDQAGSFLALALFTSVIAAHYAHAQSGNKPSIKEQAIALLRFPPLIALLVALSVGQTEYPSMLQQLF